MLNGVGKDGTDAAVEVVGDRVARNLEVEERRRWAGLRARGRRMLVRPHRCDEGVIATLELQPAEEIHGEGVWDGQQDRAEKDVVFEERRGPVLKELFRNDEPREDEQERGIDGVPRSGSLSNAEAGAENGYADGCDQEKEKTP